MRMQATYNAKVADISSSVPNGHRGLVKTWSTVSIKFEI